MFGCVYVRLRLPPPCSFSSLWCFRSKSFCSLSIYLVCGHCFWHCPPFRLESLFFVCPRCVTTRRLWLSSPCRAGLCPASSACWPVALWCCSSVSTSTSLWLSARAVLCSGRSPRPSGSDYGVRVVFPPPVATALLCAWAFLSFDLFAMGLPAVLPLFGFLVPNHWVVLDVFRVYWAALSLYAFRPSFRRMGVGSSRRDLSLRGSGPSPLPEVGVVHGLSPPLFVALLVIFHCGKVCQCPVAAFSRPLTMSWPEGLGSHALSWNFLCSLEICRCPSDLQSCVPPRGLSLSSLRAWYEICTFLLLFGWAVFLPGHRSSS